MLNDKGNLIEEGIEISSDVLKLAKSKGIKICLKTGDYSTGILKSNRRKPYNFQLIEQINTLYLNGLLYPKTASEVFILPEIPNYITTIMREMGFKTLNLKETYDLYRDEITNTHRETMMERYGVTHNNHLESANVKRKETSLKKYGTTHPLKNKQVQEKIRKTNLKKFGVENVFLSPELQEKFKETRKRKYGGVGAASPLIQEKMIKTNLKKRGVKHSMSCPKVREKIKETFVREYGVDNPFKIAEIQEKVRSTNMEKRGTHTPLLVPGIRMKVRGNNLGKQGAHYPILNSNKGQEFYERYQQLQDFRKAKELGALDKEECKRWILGAGWSQSQELALLKELCDKESKEYTTELKIASLLDDLKIPYIKKAKKAHGVRNKNGSLIELDFWFPELRLGIEINGLAYHSVNKIAYGDPKERGFHFEKFFAFHSSGIKMISFTDHDLKSKWDSVTNIIKHHLKLEDIQDSTLVDFPDLYRSFNYGLFDYQFPENPNFEDYCEAKFIEGWEYWDCGSFNPVNT